MQNRSHVCELRPARKEVIARGGYLPAQLRSKEENLKRKEEKPVSSTSATKEGNLKGIREATGVYMQAAPSMPRTLPLIHSPSCEARKQTTRAMSIGSPTRWSGDQVAAY